MIDQRNLTKSYWQMLNIMMFAILIFFIANNAFAQSSTNTIALVLCNIISQLNGPIGKGISTVAIIVLGIGLFLGKLSWGLAVATALGIGLIFGSAQIVKWVGGSTSNSAEGIDGTTCS